MYTILDSLKQAISSLTNTLIEVHYIKLVNIYKHLARKINAIASGFKQKKQMIWKRFERNLKITDIEAA